MSLIGTLNPNDRRVTVIGAGISGLIIGYVLKKKGYTVKIHEKSNRVGGIIQTKHTPHGLVETAAHSLLVTPEVRSFLDELGVETLPLNRGSRARYIYRNGKMRRIPLTLRELFNTIRHILSKPTAFSDLESATLQEWGEKYLGKAATKYLLGPFVTGVFATTPGELNASMSFPKLIPSSKNQSLLQHMRALKKQNPQKRTSQMMAFKNGTEDLVNRLSHALQSEIHLNSEIKNIDQIEGNVIISVPYYELEKITHSAYTDAIQYSPLVTATVFYPRSAFRKPPRGVGVLIPRGENLRILGCLFNSSAFSNRTQSSNVLSFTVMLGGTTDPEAVLLSDLELNTIITQELKQLLRTKSAPLAIEISRWQRAIPIYSSNLKTELTSLEQKLSKTPGKLIFTNYTGQVSIRGMIEVANSLQIR